jgi:hypothetical protein
MSLPQLILLIIVLCLIAVAIFVSMQSTIPPANMLALKTYLKLLQAKLTYSGVINPDKERAELEILLNKVKTSCSKENISGDQDLRNLFSEISQKIMNIAGGVEEETKTSWTKFKIATLNFNESYYPFVR